MTCKDTNTCYDGIVTKNYMGQPIESVRDVYYYFDDGHGGLDIPRLIYNHEFASSLFGKEGLSYWLEDADLCIGEDRRVRLKCYEYHLQQMVISPDPIDYLRRWLDGRA